MIDKKPLKPTSGINWERIFNLSVRAFWLLVLVGVYSACVARLFDII
jgi:hypothetical protein